jgi:hypothetical protein
MRVKNRRIAVKRLKTKTNPSSATGATWSLFAPRLASTGRPWRSRERAPGPFLDRAAVVIFPESHAAGFARMAAIAPPQSHGPWTMQGEIP